MTCRQWALGGALAALGATAWWYWQALPPPAPVATAERQPDYVADDLQAVTMDAAGRPVRQLRAVRLRHYPDDGSSELDEPVLWLHEAEQPAWRIRADRGWIARAGDEARLSGAVRAERAASATARALRFETSALRLWPETRQAETDRPVMLDFYADWCVPCKELDAITFVDPAVVAESRRFRTLKVDLTVTDSEETRFAMKNFGIVGVPTLIFYDSEGNEIRRINSFVNAKELLEILKGIY